MLTSTKACPFVAGRDCLQEACMAWVNPGCKLIPGQLAFDAPFEQKLKEAAPLMYRSLLDVVKIMEDTAKDCSRCGPELWSYSQQIRAGILDELIKAELAEAGIRADRIG